MSETWLPIAGHEGKYVISDRGRVKSLERTVEMVSRWGDPMMRRVPEKVLSPTFNPYPRVRLGGKGNPWRYVHHLMAEAFIGERPDCALVLHRDDVPTNNVLSNLYYGSPSQNQFDAVRNGRHHHARVTECPRGHPYSVGNTKRDGNRRSCRTCHNDRNRQYRAGLAGSREVG